METDKHYLRVGTFVLLTALAIGVFSVWLVGAYNHEQYRVYRIRFTESVSGLDVGGPIKFRGVQVGKVESMSIDPVDNSMISVDISVLKTTPVKTDTVATLKLQGITGSVYIELSSSGQGEANLVTGDGGNKDHPPEIPSQPSALAAVMDTLPDIMEKLSRITDHVDALFSDKNVAALKSTIGNVEKASNNANQLSKELKENPTKLIFSPKKKKEE